MSKPEDTAPKSRKIRLKSLSRLKREGKERPDRTVMRRHLDRGRTRWRPGGGWRHG